MQVQQAKWSRFNSLDQSKPEAEGCVKLVVKSLILGLFIVAGVVLSADTLVLRSGRSVDGTFLGGDSRSIRFDDGRNVSTYGIGEVDTVRFVGGTGSPSANGSYPPPNNYPSQNNYPANSNAPVASASQSQTYPPVSTSQQSTYSQPASSNGSVDIPSGTQVIVRLIDPVNSENDHLGQTYRASLDEPVVVNGQTVIPRGADAVAFLIDSRRSGKIQGQTSVTIDLKTVTVNGRQYDVTTTGVSEASSGRGERSAKVIGGTAAVGAIIGAIAGGGKGAAIGAGSGAAVGTAAQVMTSGQKVKIPAETRLTFTLQNPITL